ncbi:MAG: nuclear transport factor 2 family protein [Pseudomonadales bacterium]|nr:nuclear transport factor 2 family protein [Pseudomonadales bacterium]
MSTDDILTIEQICSGLIIQLANYNDAMRYEELAALFAEDGRFARPTDPENYVVGNADILASFQARPRDRLTRHIISNIQIDVHSKTAASGRSYGLLFTGSLNNQAEKFGVQANASQFIGEFYDDFVKTDRGWKFSRHTGKIIFTT